MAVAVCLFADKVIIRGRENAGLPSDRISGVRDNVRHQGERETGSGVVRVGSSGNGDGSFHDESRLRSPGGCFEAASSINDWPGGHHQFGQFERGNR